MLVEATEYGPLPNGFPSTYESWVSLHPNVQNTSRNKEKHLFIKHTRLVNPGFLHDSESLKVLLVGASIEAHHTTWATTQMTGIGDKCGL